MEWEEKAAIQLYTDHTYHAINNYLRLGGAVTLREKEEILMYIGFISSGLAKVNTTHLAVSFRGLSVSLNEIDALFQAFSASSPVTLKGYTSASVNRGEAFVFADKASYQTGTYPMIMTIESGNGVNISNLSFYSEHEIIYDKGMDIIITEFEEEEGIYFLKVKEV